VFFLSSLTFRHLVFFLTRLNELEGLRKKVKLLFYEPFAPISGPPKITDKVTIDARVKNNFIVKLCGIQADSKCLT
jgi:hypothetical protein